MNPIDPSHIYPRSQLSPGTMFNPLVALASCRDCHDKYGARDDTVRVPPDRESAAWKFINLAASRWEIKSLPPRRVPPEKPKDV